MRATGPGWGVAWGRRWAIQWATDGTLSLGLHLDPRRRRAPAGNYGPYIDLHLGPLVLSLGNNPARASGIPELRGQGATMRPDR